MRNVTTGLVDRLLKAGLSNDAVFLGQLADDIRAKNPGARPSKNVLNSVRQRQRKRYDKNVVSMLMKGDLDDVKTLVWSTRPSRNVLTQALVKICESFELIMGDCPQEKNALRVISFLIDNGADPTTVLRRAVIYNAKLLKELVALGVAPSSEKLAEMLSYCYGYKRRYEAVAVLGKAYPEIARECANGFMYEILDATENWARNSQIFLGADIDWVYRAAAQIPGGVLEAVLYRFESITPYRLDYSKNIVFPKCFDIDELADAEPAIRRALVFLKRFANDSRWNPYISAAKRHAFVDKIDGQVCASKLALEMETSM